MTTYAVTVMGKATVARTYEVIADSQEVAEQTWKTGRPVAEYVKDFTPTFIETPVPYFEV